MADYEQMNGIALAYIGMRFTKSMSKHLLDKGMTKPNKLHKRATRYVSAKAQAALISQMEEQNLLTDEEKEYFRRGRNAKSYTSAKNTSVVTYRISTGFEALFGYLYLSGQKTAWTNSAHGASKRSRKDISHEGAEDR